MKTTIPLPSVTEKLRNEYLSGTPWPHIMLQDLIPTELLDEVAAEVRGLDRTQMRDSRSRRHIKRESNDRSLLGPATLELQDFYDSPPFIEFLSSLTGVSDLLPDPEHYAAGIHETPQGGKTMIHTDFSHQPVSRLHHRVNLLTYLNPGWQEEWGGQLELWPPDMSALGARINPTLNTTIIWETHAGTPHGLPTAVAGPPGTSRFAIASYYYTTEPGNHQVERATLGTYAARPSDSRWTSVPLPRDLARALLPASVQRTLWRGLERARRFRS